MHSYFLHPPTPLYSIIFYIYNVDQGLRYCVWQSPDKATMEKIFGDLEISFESMTEVQETKPDMWGRKWKEHLEAEATADTLAV